MDLPNAARSGDAEWHARRAGAAPSRLWCYNSGIRRREHRAESGAQRRRIDCVLRAVQAGR
tara:strand:+ start:99 stop:281 length:183 start_codon:yes stop_codon:yes gene_type:complete